MRKLLAAAIVLGLPLAITAGPEAKAPPVSLVLKDRHGHATPVRTGTSFSGGGNVDVQQPAPDTVIVTFSGGVVAADHPCCGSASAMNFDLDQLFEVVFEKPEVKAAKLSIEARVVGVLRGGRKGTASESGGCVNVSCGSVGLLTLSAPDHEVVGCDSLSINDKSGPAETPVSVGPLALHAHWQLSAAHPKALLGKSASAEFAPDPALDALWVGGPRDPFHGAGKKDFGFQMTLKLEAEPPPNANGKEARRIGDLPRSAN